MTGIQKAATMGFLAAAIVAGYVAVAPKHGHVHEMLFPKGIHVTGHACHQLVHILPDGTWDVLAYHFIDGDMTNMTEDEKKAAIVRHTQGDLDEAGVACSDEPPALLPRAIADSVKRCDGCGTDCWITSCDAHIGNPYCVLGGTNCVISFICCGGPGSGCPASCDV